MFVKKNSFVAQDCLQTFARFFQLCYRLYFHISEKLEDTTFKPSSAALHFFTEALAYLMLVLPSLSQVIIHGILLNYRRQEEQLILLFQDPSVDCPEGLRIHQRVDDAPEVDKDMRMLLRANRRGLGNFPPTLFLLCEV